MMDNKYTISCGKQLMKILSAKFYHLRDREYNNYGNSQCNINVFFMYFSFSPFYCYPIMRIQLVIKLILNKVAYNKMRITSNCLKKVG